MKKESILLVFGSLFLHQAQAQNLLASVTNNTTTTTAKNAILLLQKEWTFAVLGVKTDGQVSKIENCQLLKKATTFPQTMVLHLMTGNKFTSKNDFKAYNESEDVAYFKTTSGSWKLVENKKLILTYPKLTVAYSLEKISETELVLGGDEIALNTMNADNINEVGLAGMLWKHIKDLTQTSLPMPKQTIQYLLFGKPHQSN